MRMHCRIWIFGLGLTAMTAAGAADPFANIPDPTRPSGWHDGGGSTVNQGLVLQGTTISASRRIAVINGQRLAVGDRVQGATVVEVQPFQVRLQRAGRDITLRLTPSLAKEKI
jgi:hypothetical protein